MTTAIETPVFLPNKGVVLNKPQEFMTEMFSPFSRNMEFYNELLQGRGGLGKLFQTSVGISILENFKFRDLSNIRHYLFATRKDIYAIDFGNSRFDILTPTYTTGTIEVQAGTPTKFRGTGTLWLANVKVGDYVKIGAGNIHTGSTWYEVLTVDSNVLITLTSAAPTTGAGSAYVARKIFTGTDLNIWTGVQFSDDVLGEVFLLTNGVDKPYYWTGANQVVLCTGLPTGFTAAKYITTYAGRVVVGWTVEGGNNQPQRVRWSDPANCISWQDSDLRDFTDEGTYIKGLTRFGGYIQVWKEEEAYNGRYVGGDFILDFEKSAQCKGTRSGYSIVVKNDFMSYYGADKKIHRWNLLQDDIVSEYLFPETKEFDPNYDQYIRGFDVARKNQIRWFCPYGSTTKSNYTIAWDYQQDILQVWAYAHVNACASFGSFYLTSDVYADDPTYGALFADETSGFADDSTFLSNSELVMYGGYDGYLRLADSGTQDDGNSYTRVLRLKRLNFGLINKIKRLWKQIWWLEAAATGSVTVKLRVDDKSSYEPTTKTISLVPVDLDKEIIKIPIRWDKHAQNFQPEISATVHFAVLGVMNLWFAKKKSYAA